MKKTKSTTNLKAKRVAKKPEEESISDISNKRLLDMLDEHVMCNSSFDFDDQLERYIELFCEVRKRLGFKVEDVEGVL
jgi:CTP synthase (UTP-ammonia lyase)